MSKHAMYILARLMHRSGRLCFLWPIVSCLLFGVEALSMDCSIPTSYTPTFCATQLQPLYGSSVPYNLSLPLSDITSNDAIMNEKTTDLNTLKLYSKACYDVWVRWECVSRFPACILGGNGTTDPLPVSVCKTSCETIKANCLQLFRMGGREGDLPDCDQNQFVSSAEGCLKLETTDDGGAPATCPEPLIPDPRPESVKLSQPLDTCVEGCCIPCVVTDHFYPPSFISFFFIYEKILATFSVIGSILVVTTYSRFPSLILDIISHFMPQKTTPPSTQSAGPSSSQPGRQSAPPQPTDSQNGSVSDLVNIAPLTSPKGLPSGENMPPPPPKQIQRVLSQNNFTTLSNISSYPSQSNIAAHGQSQQHRNLLPQKSQKTTLKSIVLQWYRRIATSDHWILLLGVCFTWFSCAGAAGTTKEFKCINDVEMRGGDLRCYSQHFIRKLSGYALSFTSLGYTLNCCLMITFQSNFLNRRSAVWCTLLCAIVFGTIWIRLIGWNNVTYQWFSECEPANDPFGRELIMGAYSVLVGLNLVATFFMFVLVTLKAFSTQRVLALSIKQGVRDIVKLGALPLFYTLYITVCMVAAALWYYVDVRRLMYQDPQDLYKMGDDWMRCIRSGNGQGKCSDISAPFVMSQVGAIFGMAIQHLPSLGFLFVFGFRRNILTELVGGERRWVGIKSAVTERIGLRSRRSHGKNTTNGTQNGRVDTGGTDARLEDVVLKSVSSLQFGLKGSKENITRSYSAARLDVENGAGSKV